MLNVLKNAKYKLISATMGIGLLASTGLASVVHASPVNVGPVNTNSAVTYRQNNESFKTQLDRMVSAGVINAYQESRVMDVYNSKVNFKGGLDNLVAKGVINNYQKTRILDVFNNIAQPNNSSNSKAAGSAAAQQIVPTSYHK